MWGSVSERCRWERQRPFPKGSSGDVSSYAFLLGTSLKAYRPVAVYTLSPFMGPEIGPLYSGYVQRTPTGYAAFLTTLKICQPEHFLALDVLCHLNMGISSNHRIIPRVFHNHPTRTSLLKPVNPQFVPETYPSAIVARKASR